MAPIFDVVGTCRNDGRPQPRRPSILPWRTQRVNFWSIKEDGKDWGERGCVGSPPMLLSGVRSSYCFQQNAWKQRLQSRQSIKDLISSSPILYWARPTLTFGRKISAILTRQRAISHFNVQRYSTHASLLESSNHQSLSHLNVELMEQLPIQTGYNYKSDCCAKKILHWWSLFQNTKLDNMMEERKAQIWLE